MEWKNGIEMASVGSASHLSNHSSSSKPSLLFLTFLCSVLCFPACILNHTRDCTSLFYCAIFVTVISIHEGCYQRYVGVRLQRKNKEEQRMMHVTSVR